VFEGDPNSPSAVYVAGITSHGDSACNTYGVSTRVDAFASFIQAFVGP
jgi:secreted trypsin-like serine protease